MTSTTPNQPLPAEAMERPEVVSLLRAGRLLGMGRTKAYRLAKAGEFPCRVLRIGGRYAVPVRGLRALLDPPAEQVDHTGPDSSSHPAGKEG
ncbi:helix-turn-helix domain-containing protein [Nonomuraea bangladeshensis]|uniref:helix-turn-helix transcriptional regulator n=1 Tax=Nonomuraea bangladeshensis TaxID=404385 RepID=UPI0031D6D1FF